jgi:thioredoxin 1
MRIARALLVLVAVCLPACYAAGWQIVLKDGKTIECDGPPIIVDGSYLFRSASGEDGSLSADLVDLEKTDRANGVDPHPQWVEIGPGGRVPQQRPSAGTAKPSGAGILTLGDSNFNNQVLAAKGPVLVEFWASWCGPCKMFAPTVDAIAGKYDGKLTVGTVDVDENEAMVRSYRVAGTPSLLLFKDGRVVGRILGAVGQSQIEQMLRANL